jgi:hypothetical protein
MVDVVKSNFIPADVTESRTNGEYIAPNEVIDDDVEVPHAPLAFPSPGSTALAVATRVPQPQTYLETSRVDSFSGSLVTFSPAVFQPQTYLDSSRMDPFSTSQLTITLTLAPIYNRYFKNFMPTFEPLHQEREEYNSWLVPLTLKEPALLYALLACMVFDVEEVSSATCNFGPDGTRSMLSQRVQYHVQAIQALNRSLSDPASALEASTLLAVHFLSWQEVS